MADAIPVHRVVPEPAVKKAKPAAPAPVVDHDKYVGKDHPEFGKWNGHGWQK